MQKSCKTAKLTKSLLVLIQVQIQFAIAFEKERKILNLRGNSQSRYKLMVANELCLKIWTELGFLTKIQIVSLFQVQLQTLFKLVANQTGT